MRVFRGTPPANQFTLADPALAHRCILCNGARPASLKGFTMWIAATTAFISAFTALAVVLMTNRLTHRREHESDWRKIRFEQYREFMLALSQIVEGRATDEAMRKYTDAVNSMALVAPMSVLKALQDYQAEISCSNPQRTDSAHDQLLNVLIRELRRDVHTSASNDDPSLKFQLLAPPRLTDSSARSSR